MAGYKVHVGDLPSAWAAQELADWAHGVLRRHHAELPADTNANMGRSHLGYAQMLLTFSTSDQAQRAQHVLNNVRIPQASRASNAAYWVPWNYNPWANDPRWANVPAHAA